MKLLVAFKVCPDLDLLQVNDLVVREEMGVDTHFLPNILNCYDESSLELALRFRDQAQEETGQQVLLLGREAPLGNHGTTAQMTACLLGYPLISSVTDVKPGEGDTLRVRTMECGREMEQTVFAPCVLAVGNAVVSKLRIPSLRMRMKWKNIPCEQYELKRAQTYGYPVPVKLEVPDRKRSGYLSPERGGAAVADVFQRGLEERLEML